MGSPSNSRVDWSFTPVLTDIDGDEYSDLLLVSDFVTSDVYLYTDEEKYERVTDRNVIKDQNGMGSAVADFDNDGDMDWFVTSVYDLDIDGGQRFGNRLYRNIGKGLWEDATDESGTANGEWGWGACAADFDQDGYVDLMMVNGWWEDSGKDFNDKPIRFWRNLGEGMEFEEMAETVGMTNDGQGRGLVCFDSDGDGDQDVVIVNNSDDHIVYYRNETSNENNYLIVELQGTNTNQFGVGARITVSTDSGDQIRDMVEATTTCRTIRWKLTSGWAQRHVLTFMFVGRIRRRRKSRTSRQIKPSQSKLRRVLCDLPSFREREAATMKKETSLKSSLQLRKKITFSLTGAAEEGDRF